VTFSSGTQFGHFRILGLLGQGAMASVYLAEQATPSRLVALKIIDEELGASPEFRLRFQREANILALLEHPNIVPVWEAGEVDGRLFISSRYVRGGTLRDLLGQPLSYEETIRYLSPVADALDYAHRRGVVHRDIKPSNILVTEPDDAGKRSLIVADFGIARLFAEAGESTQVTRTGMAIGTVAYMAPEQFGGQQVDGRADQYALAIIAFQMLTGSVPFTGTLSEMAAKVAVSPPPQPTSVNPRLPQAVDRVLASALAKRPEDRYPSCSAFVAALDAALLPGGQQGQRPGPSPTPAGGSNRGLLFALIGAAVAAVAAIAAVATVLALNSGHHPPNNNQAGKVTPVVTHVPGPAPAPRSPTPAPPTVTPRPVSPSPTPTQGPPGPFVAAAPNVLLNALGQSSFMRQLLPSGFSVSSVDSVSVTPQAAQNRAVGDMQFTINGPDNAGDFVDFVAFSNRTDALAYLNGVSDTTDPVTLLDVPSGCSELSDNLNGKAVGLTNCYAVVGNTVVRSLTQVYGTQGHGNGPDNDIMTRAAVATLLLVTLEQTAVPANQFPYVTAAGQTQTATADSAAQQRNAAGTVVKVPIPSGDTQDEADFYVFQTDRDAAGFLSDRGASTDANLASLGFPYTCVSFGGTGGGQSDCYVQIGTVIVRGSTRIASKNGSGNPQLAAQIATAGVRFLQAVEGGR